MRAAARRLGAVVRATVLELSGEPFVFLTLLSSLALTVLAPAFHYHQFGEPSRLARDAGFSAFLVGGTLASVFGAIRSVRREIEGGTCEAALTHAVSPGQFLAAKALGFSLVLGHFLVAVFCVTLVMVDGAEVGGAIAARTGTLSRPWGPSLAIGVAVLLLPIAFAAALNRIARWRFTLTATRTTLVLSLVGLCFLLARGRAALVFRHLPVWALAALPVLLLTVAASVFAFSGRANVAAAGTGLLAAVLLPALGNYCTADVLANGGRLSLPYVIAAVVAAIPAFAVLIFSFRALSSAITNTANKVARLTLTGDATLCAKKGFGGTNVRLVVDGATLDLNGRDLVFERVTCKNGGRVVNGTYAEKNPVKGAVYYLR